MSAHVNRTIALSALLHAADDAGVAPEALTTLQYRRIRTRPGALPFPSEITISLLFGGWQRACHHAADACLSPEHVVEEQVREALYGSCHHVERQPMRP